MKGSEELILRMGFIFRRLSFPFRLVHCQGLKRLFEMYSSCIDAQLMISFMS